ncbi:MAG: MFS transporter [Candidatus Thorarchaeota archaeon]|jgi:MFS family permease
MPETRSDWAALKSVYNSAFLCSLGFFFVSFIIPIVAYDPSILGASGFQVALIFALLTLGSAGFSPIAGRITKHGRRRVSILFGATVRGLSYVGMAIAISIGSIDFLILNSLIWGMGAAFYHVGSDAEISERVIRENRAEAFGRRSAANGRGQVLGTFIGFAIFFMFNLYVAFFFYAVMNVIGGLVVISDRRPPIPSRERIIAAANTALGKSVIALVFAAAIDAFVLALLSPFVELYIFESFTTELELVAMLYLPGGIITAFLGGYIGRIADRSNQVAIVAGSALIVSASTITLAFLPILTEGVWYGMYFVAPLFTLQIVAGTAAYTVMTSVEGFGRFEAVMGLARFSGPLAGGLFWDLLGPMTPFIFVGLVELLLIPAYVIGMKHYQKAINAEQIS